MKTDRWRAQVVTCAIISCLCAGLSFVAFQQNSWGKWRKNTALSSCLPLPPPIGCAEHSNSRDILIGQDTDFSWLLLISFLLSLGTTALSMIMLAGEDENILGIEKLAIKKSMRSSFLIAAILTVLTCLIATFRINIISTLQRRQGLFVVSGLTPVNSISFYLSCLVALLSLTGCYAANVIHIDEPGCKKKLSKTVKQHMARNLMYPDDQRSTKMVTFSSMSPDMEEFGAELCVKAVMQYGLEEDIAENIKQTFEAKYGPTWHCAVGANFGSAIHHRTNEYIEVAMPQMSVVLFRCDEPVVTDQQSRASSITTSTDLR